MMKNERQAGTKAAKLMLYKLQRPASFFAMLVLAAVILISCERDHKKKEVRVNAATNELEYCIWIYKNGRPIDKFSLPIDKASCQNIDSLNKKADSLLLKIENAENCR